ncbi:MAG TPA: ATP-binding cassette domain-containing protein [Acidimicrobiales bacterium]|nr:ATP-binding cassette domain-containing protein [Acidimicrobiales bacterium]
MTLAIQLEDLRKTFAGEVRALDGVSFGVEPGTIFGLLGPNGAGKTTVVRILTTVLRADSGRAYVLGHDVMTEPVVVRTLIGLAGQNAAVDENLTGAENLWMVGRLNHMSRAHVSERSAQLLEQFSLADAANRPTKTYSGGMRRRLDVAASLVANPKVLFLDEPTTGLDPEGRADVWAMIESRVAEGTTVLLTTQYLEEADRLAEHLVVIDHGKVIASGTPASLKAGMGATVLDLGLADEPTALRAGEALKGVNEKAPAVYGRTVEVNVNDGPRVVTEALRILEAHGIVPTTLALREPSLDDVFLALTGKRTEVEEAEGLDGAPSSDGRRSRKRRSRSS